MESSITEHDLHKSFRSPPRRRRSTFFERRDSLVPQPLSENVDLNLCIKATDNKEKHNQDLLRYYNKLLDEKEQWKKEVKNRRNKYHDLKQQYQIAAKAPNRSRLSYSALSNDDIEFLKAKVGISKLVDSQLKLHKSIKQTYALFRRATELDDIILSNSEDKVKKITEHILDNSTLEPDV
ncbi:unnamed protein product [Parnassius apollo]|uniref:(apollo) hypothetical protein n=1 Tax=Parnassius apollo TaxID=110799 RepID=A0A8S3XYW3_PARAO|nr:unnamed protein product [Parnassius apollo]